MGNTQKSTVPAQTGTKTKVSTIGRIKAAEMINDSKGRFFSAVYATKEDPNREIICRRSVTKGLKGTGKSLNTAVLGLISVWDMKKKAYRMLNLQTLKSLKIAGNQYRVK